MGDKAAATECPAGAELAQAAEIKWMHFALRRPSLGRKDFNALMGLIQDWPDEKLIALAQEIDPYRTVADRAAALRAIEALFQSRMKLLSELLDPYPLCLRTSS